MPLSPTLSQLLDFQTQRTFLRIQRAELDPEHVTGAVVAASSKLLALAVLSDGVRPNGFTVVRRADLTQLFAPDPYAPFLTRALKLRGDKLTRWPKLDLTSWQSLMTGAAKRFPLLTVQLEIAHPDGCFIGRPVAMTPRSTTFLTLGPDARWDREQLEKLAWKDVTRVDFGGEYEQALALVAGADGGAD